MVNPKSKKQWHPTQPFEADALPSVKSLTKVKHEPGKRGMRRTAMLNKIFMKQITDLMSTGTVAMNVVGRGIEISKVSVTPDLQKVNVFWVCKGDASDDTTNNLLSKVAGALRHELSTLRIMGEIPYIEFVKDKQEAVIVDLDRRLAIADYGEDYTPTDLGQLLKSEFTLNTKLSPEEKAKIKQLEDKSPVFEEPLPVMTNNVFGLDHGKIMSRLLAARKKTRDAWSGLNTTPGIISYRVPVDKVNEPAVANQRKELADFLLKRQIEQKKLHKRINDPRQVWLAEEATTREAGDADVEEDDEYEDDDEESYSYYVDGANSGYPEQRKQV